MKRTRFWAISWLFGLFLVVFSTVQAQRGNDPLTISYVAVQESESRLDLNVFFTVRDQNGEPISNPSISDATIQLLGMDSEPVSADVRKPQTPIYVVLLIDGSGSMQGVMPDVRLAARAAIDQAPPNAFFSVIQFDEQITVIEEFTDNHERVKAAINGVASQANKGTCLYNAAFDAIGRLDRQITSPQEQRAIILFTDGRDQLRANDPTPCSDKTLPDVIQAARPFDITRPSTPIHTIGLFGGSGDTNSINQPDLERLARETYAFSAFGNVSQVDSLFARIMRGLNSQLVASASVFAQQGTNQAILSVSTRRDDLPQTAPFTFVANFAHNAPPGAVAVIDNGVAINEQILSFSLGISNSEQIDRLVVRVEDDGGIRVIPDDIIVSQPGSAAVVEINVAGFEPEEEYQIKVFALNQSDEFIRNEKGEEILIERPFKMSEPEEIQFEFLINDVTVNYASQLMTITLDISNPDLVQVYSGFVSDSDDNSTISQLPETLFSEEQKTTKRIVASLPDKIFVETEKKEYELTLILEIYDANNQEFKQFRESGEFSPTPPTPPGFIATLIGRLGASPAILSAIVGVLLTMILLVMWRSQRAKNKLVPVVRPPVENKTMLFSDPIFKDLHHREDEEGFDTISPTVATAIQSERESVPTQKAKVVVMRMPKEQIMDSRVFNMFPLTIGREKADVIVREDPYISRRHVEIGVENNRFYVRDLGSKSGVQVDGVQVAAGQKVTIGRKTRLKLSSKTMIEITVAH